MSEKKFYNALKNIFAVDYKKQFSSTKTISRGEFAVALAKILDYKVDEITQN